MTHIKAIELINVNKAFTERRKRDNGWLSTAFSRDVLCNINLSIPTGSIFGLAGLNGVGKTTIIKIILDLLRADSGSVNIFSKSNLDPANRINVYYLPEKFSPSQYLKGSEFLKLSLSFYNKQLDCQHVNNVLEKLDLDVNALDKVIKTYSKGMRQKLGLAACLLSGVRLLILDEPMTGLDPKARIILKKALIEYRENGGTIFFSSHILDDVEEICDNVAVLHCAEIKFQGSPADFITTYHANKAEKAFLNCINV